MNNGTGWSNKRGFTLVEISIGLVIIGLLIAGIVTGKSMIEAAELRGLLSQIDKIDTAVNSFKTKYNCLPGDCITATNFFPSAGCPNGNGDPATTCNGDGSGYVNHYGSNTTQKQLEHLVFWQHLTLAGLMEGQYNGTSGPSHCCRHAVIGTNVPKTPVSGLGISIYNHSGFETSWGLTFGVDRGLNTHILLIGAEYPPFPTFSGKLKVVQTRSLDQKIDDGVASTGKFGIMYDVVAYGTSGATVGPNGSYSYSTTNLNTPSTAVAFRSW